MIITPMPRDREKNIWPPAVASTPRKFSFRGSKLGTNMNFRPSTAPGRVQERMMMTTSITARAGMPMEQNFSIPPDTPPMTMTMVSSRKMMPNTTPSVWLSMKLSKIAPPLRPLVPNSAPTRLPTFSTMYFRQ